MKYSPTETQARIMTKTLTEPHATLTFPQAMKANNLTTDDHSPILGWAFVSAHQKTSPVAYLLDSADQ